MAYNNNVITAPVSIYDVQRALGTSENRVGGLCTHANINKWAKYKPIKFQKIQPVTDAERLSVLYGFHDNNGDLIPIYQSILGMYADIRNETAEWSYTRPSGDAASPYRLTDFDKYVQSVDGWGGLNDKWDTIFGGTIVINRRTSDNMLVHKGENVIFNIENDTDGELGYGNLLQMKDFNDWTPGSIAFKNWYAGLFFRHSISASSYDKCLISGSSIENGVNILSYFQQSGTTVLDSGTYTVVPFFIEPYSGMPTGWTDGDLGSGRRIISLNGAHFNIRMASDQQDLYDHLRIYCSSFTQANGSTTVVISYANNRSTAYSLNEFYLLLCSENSYDSFDNGWEAGWINQTDCPYGTTTYYSQIISDQCWTLADVNARKRYARTKNVGVNTIPANSSGVLATVTIDATGDGFGTFDEEHSVWFMCEFTEAIVGNQSRIVL